MEENNKIEVDDILARELDNFNVCWNTLNNNCKTLQDYSVFIQKYLDLMNQYYMNLTELNSRFPHFSSEITEIDFDSSIKTIGQILSSSIQIQLNNLLIFLSKTQTLVHSLNQSINYSKNFLEESQKINDNFFLNIKKLNNNYYNQYLSMINSFDNLEKKLIENYIKKNYNTNEDLDEADENALKNCVALSKKLENSFLNFDKNKIKDYIYEYNSNINNIKNNRYILNKTFYECILRIINNLEEYFNNLINEIEKEKHMNDITLKENNENENIFNSNLSEKEINSIIFKLFNSKKYNIKIIKNEIINCEQSNINKNDNSVNSTILLSDEDRYNIIKEIYNYDFVSINKNEYILETEKEKLKINDLTKKLLSYDLQKDQMESITNDEIKILNNMVINDDEYMLYFLSVLTQYRSKGMYRMPKRVFDVITNIFQESLNKVAKNKNMKIGADIVTLSFSFFMIEEKDRYYFGDIIKNNKIFKSKEFWNDYIVNMINIDLERLNGDENSNKSNIDEILLSKILPSADSMSKFGLEKDEIINIIEPLMNQYGMKKKSKEDLLTLVKQQI